jgi:uncharacterized membrane protein YedE/YeeE
LVVGVLLALFYDQMDYSIRGGFLFFGLTLGIIMQRTRFCFVRAFREPFMTGDGSASKAVALAVLISVVGFSILKWSDMKDWEAQVSAGFWFGSLVGGIIFGIGMSITGGCASGTLWRAGEGHIKLLGGLDCIRSVWFVFQGMAYGKWMVYEVRKCSLYSGLYRMENGDIFRLLANVSLVYNCFMERGN